MNTNVTRGTFPLDVELMTENKKGRKHNMIKCGLCGKEFKDDQFNEYAAHVQKCAAEMSMKKKTEDMKKIQSELEEVKRAKIVYEGLRDKFKKKYPDIYKVNFPDDCVGDTKDSNNIDKNTDVKLSNKTDRSRSLLDELHDENHKVNLHNYYTYGDLYTRLLNDLFR